MALIDDLKRQAEDAAARQEQQRQMALARDSAFKKRAQPAMLRAYYYLRELVDTVTRANLDVRVDYEVEGAGRITGLRQHDYVLTADDVPDVTTMTFGFVCSRPDKVRFMVRSRGAVQRQREYLWKHGLLFTFREELSSSAGNVLCGDFEMEAHVRVTVRFEIEPAERRIQVITKNLRHLGENAYLIEVDQFSEEFVEELAKAALRKPNRFDELTGFSVAEDIRSQLRERIAREAREKAREVGGEEPRGGGLKGLFKRRK